jgi:hypothetical protein
MKFLRQELEQGRLAVDQLRLLWGVGSLKVIQNETQYHVTLFIDECAVARHGNTCIALLPNIKPGFLDFDRDNGRFWESTTKFN